MDKISVIIPVYNAEKFIAQCIFSLINQTYKNIEIIAVNDCSKDNSLALLNKYAEADKRITVVNQDTNKGPSHARTLGLAKSTGQYISYVDADDWLPLNALAILLDKIQKEKADMVTGTIVRIADKHGLIKHNYTPKMNVEIIEQPELFDKYYISFFGVSNLTISTSSKLYKREVLIKANIPPNNFRYGEDLMFSMLLHPYLTKITFVDDVVYYYRYGGNTSVSNPTYLEDIKKQYRIKEQIIAEYKYYKALPYIKYELIKHFYFYALELLIKDNYSKNKLRKFVLKELNDEIYTDATRGIKLDEKGIAVKERNVDEIVNSLYAKKMKERIIYRMKRIVFYLLNF
ncbi:glycosyltransferase family 2 protein [Bacteroides sp. 519]|uniref:glycosyltransferase family 2 protein n=1 Tax=Bacteroides sp. 519 TaxID=2302937 RepID=UPI0013D16F8D|nr:glycosyltransferase family 2 protein [Bacteroides sp. 519]